MLLSERKLEDIKIGDIVKSQATGNYGFIGICDPYFDDGRDNKGLIRVFWTSGNISEFPWTDDGVNCGDKVDYIGHISELGKHYENSSLPLPGLQKPPQVDAN